MCGTAPAESEHSHDHGHHHGPHSEQYTSHDAPLPPGSNAWTRYGDCLMPCLNPDGSRCTVFSEGAKLKHCHGGH
jgi:hypothetical protein